MSTQQMWTRRLFGLTLFQNPLGIDPHLAAPAAPSEKDPLPSVLPGDGLAQNSQEQVLVLMGSPANELIFWSLGRGGGPKAPSSAPVDCKKSGKLTKGAGGQRENQGIGSSRGPGLPQKTGCEGTGRAVATVEHFPLHSRP